MLGFFLTWISLDWAFDFVGVGPKSNSATLRPLNLLRLDLSMQTGMICCGFIFLSHLLTFVLFVNERKWVNKIEWDKKRLPRIRGVEVKRFRLFCCVWETWIETKEPKRSTYVRENLCYFERPVMKMGFFGTLRGA